MVATDRDAFIKGLRSDQARLRRELHAYVIGAFRVGRRPIGGAWEDFTPERIATINAEIARIEKTIEFIVG
jgi:hypothetical protein